MDTRQKIIDLQISLSVYEVYRMIGGTPEGARPEHRELVDRLMHEALAVIRPRGVYALYDVERMSARELQLAGGPAIRGPIAGYLKPAKKVAAFVVTIGEQLEGLTAQRLQAGQRLAGYTLDAIGSAAADAAADALADHLQWHELAPDEGLTPFFNPGYCGVGLEEQVKLFAIVNAAPIGVTLLPTMIMHPIKSVSGLIGVGPQSAVDGHGVPCRYCDLQQCRMRIKK